MYRQLRNKGVPGLFLQPLLQHHVTPFQRHFIQNALRVHIVHEVSLKGSCVMLK